MKNFDKTGNTKFTAELIAERIQNPLPSRGADPESQHEIASLRAKVATLKQQLGEPKTEYAPSAPGTSSGSVNTPAGRSC